MLHIRLSLLEIFLIETVAWLGLWLLNDYIATLLTLVLTAIVFAVLLVALFSEWVERSKVPRKYFWVMALSVVAPVFAALLYALIFGGHLQFLEKGL